MAYYVSNVLVKEVPATPDASRGAFLMSTGTSGTGYGWAYMGGTTTGIAIDNSAWRYRSIYTHGYIACGYKGSNPWRSVNKTWHPTDTTFYVGEQIMNTQSYTNGTWSDYNGYIVANGGMSASGSVVASYGLHNGTCRMYSGDGYSSSGISYDYQGNDPKNEGLSYGSAGYGSHVGGMRMDRSRVDPCCAEDIKGQSGWIVGGGSSVTSRLNFTSEVMYAGWDSGTDGIGDGASGELRGWFAWPSTYRYVTWSNSTWSGQGSGYGQVVLDGENGKISGGLITGVRIEGSSAGKLGEKLGLKQGDILSQLGDYKLIDVMSYMQALSKFKKGDKTVLVIKRDKEELKFDIQF